MRRTYTAEELAGCLPAACKDMTVEYITAWNAFVRTYAPPYLEPREVVAAWLFFLDGWKAACLEIGV